MGPTEDAADPLDDPRVFRAVQEFQAELDAGARPDASDYLARYPDVAGALTGCLRGLALLRGVAARLADTGVPVEPGRAFPEHTQLGDFRVVREVGRGGMGVVYEAEQLSLGRRVALKVLSAAAPDDRTRLRFRNEARAAAALNHPHIVPVYAVGAEGDTDFLVMRFIDGRSLADLARDPRPAAGPFPPAAEFYRGVARLAVQAAGALQHAHAAGIVHRDIKPGNLLVEPGGHLWVADFGLAHRPGLGDLTRTGELVGTVRYMSPERAAGGPAGDPRADVYSLGITMYEVLTRRPPFPGTDAHDILRQVLADDPLAPRRIDPGVPADLETVILKAMAKEPGERYATAAAFAADLERFLAGRPVLARRAGRAWRAVKWVRRNPTPAALVGVIVLSLSGGLAGVGWKWREAEGHRRRAEELAADLTDRAALMAEARGRLAKANDRVERARIHTRDRRWAQARIDLDRAVELVPGHTTARSERADLYCRMGLWEWARPDATEVAAHRPPDDLDMGYAQVYRLGALAARTGDPAGYRRACADALRADRLAAASPLARWWVGRLCGLDPGGHPDPDRVVELVRAADNDLGRLADPAGPSADDRRRALGLAYLRAGRPDDVIRTLANPIFPAPLPVGVRPLECVLLAWAHLRLGRPDEARQAFDQADRWLDEVVLTDWSRPAPPRPLDAWPDWAEFTGLYDECQDALFPAGRADGRRAAVRYRALAALGHWEQADTELARTVAAFPTDPRYRLTAVRDYAGGRPDRAVELLTRAAEQAPADPLVWRELFRLRVKQGDAARAAAALDAWAALRPTDAGVRQESFRAYADREDWPRARAELDRLAALRPKDAALRLEGFRYLADRDRWPEAYAERDRLLAADPGNLPLSFQFGVYFWNRNDHDRARPEYLRTALIRPGGTHRATVNSWYNLGAGFYRQHNWLLAQVCYRVALVYDPAYDEVVGNVARTQLRLGDWPGAAATFGRAVALNPNGPKSHDHRRNQAFCYVVAGMIPEYRRTCAAFLAQHTSQAKPDAEATNLLLWACTIHPAGWVDGPRLLRIAEQYKAGLAPRTGNSLHGRCLFRAGRPDEARPLLTAAAGDDWDCCHDLAFLAALEAGAGHLAAARGFLDRLPTNRWFYAQQPEGWQVQVYYGVVRREAEEAAGRPLTPIDIGK